MTQADFCILKQKHFCKLINRCAVRLSHHRLKPVADGISLPPSIDKVKARARTLRQSHLSGLFSTV
jgi:hypothetical protein